MRGASGFLMGVLLIALLVLGFMYYRETSNNVTLRVDLPKVQIEKK